MTFLTLREGAKMREERVNFKRGEKWKRKKKIFPNFEMSTQKMIHQIPNQEIPQTIDPVDQHWQETVGITVEDLCSVKMTHPFVLDESLHPMIRHAIEKRKGKDRPNDWWRQWDRRVFADSLKKKNIRRKKIKEKSLKLLTFRECFVFRTSAWRTMTESAANNFNN